MVLIENSKMRRNFGINNEELMAIKHFLQGSVYCWVKNQNGEVFAVRDLMGGSNFDWNKTPLHCLYKKHITNGKNSDAAIKEAGKDLGGILKVVLKEDKRTYETHEKGKSKGYRWVGSEA